MRLSRTTKARRGLAFSAPVSHSTRQAMTRWMLPAIRLFPDSSQYAINQGLIQIDTSAHKLFGQWAYLRKQPVAFGFE